MNRNQVSESTGQPVRFVNKRDTSSNVQRGGQWPSEECSWFALRVSLDGVRQQMNFLSGSYSEQQEAARCHCGPKFPFTFILSCLPSASGKEQLLFS